jgi:hypothetical protein
VARVRPTALADERQHLVAGPAAFTHYQALITERGINCYRCTD